MVASSYLACVHGGEFQGAVDNLHRYFDYTCRSAAGGREHGLIQYASLNLATLYFRFGYVAEAIQAMHETVRIAQQVHVRCAALQSGQARPGHGCVAVVLLLALPNARRCAWFSACVSDARRGALRPCRRSMPLAPCSTRPGARLVERRAFAALSCAEQRPPVPCTCARVAAPPRGGELGAPPGGAVHTAWAVPSAGVCCMPRARLYVVRTCW